MFASFHPHSLLHIVISWQWFPLPTPQNRSSWKVTPDRPKETASVTATAAGARPPLGDDGAAAPKRPPLSRGALLSADQSGPSAPGSQFLHKDGLLSAAVATPTELVHTLGTVE